MHSVGSSALENVYCAIALQLALLWQNTAKCWKSSIDFQWTETLIKINIFKTYLSKNDTFAVILNDKLNLNFANVLWVMWVTVLTKLLVLSQSRLYRRTEGELLQSTRNITIKFNVKLQFSLHYTQCLSIYYNENNFKGSINIYRQLFHK